MASLSSELDTLSKVILGYSTCNSNNLLVSDFEPEIEMVDDGEQADK